MVNVEQNTEILKSVSAFFNVPNKAWYNEWVNWSAANLETKIDVIIGNRNRMSLVISIIMIVNEMVNRETPPKKAAAPIKANAPGSIQL